MPRCLRIVLKSGEEEFRSQNSEEEFRVQNCEEEFRSQNSEVRMQVRASRGRYGLLTRSLTLTVLFGGWSMSMQLWAPDVSRRRSGVGRSLTVTVLFGGWSMSMQLWAPDAGRFLWARLWRGSRIVGTERTPLPADALVGSSAEPNGRASDCTGVPFNRFLWSRLVGSRGVVSSSIML
jgi:hypothetical protein